MVWGYFLVTIIYGREKKMKLTEKSDVFQFWVDVSLTALMIAVLSFTAVIIPALVFVVGLIWTVPLAVLIRKHTLWAGVTALALGAVPLLFMLGSKQAGFILVQFAPLALLYGVSLKNQFSSGKTILTGVILTFFSTVAAFYFLFNWDLALVVREFQQQTQAALTAYKTMGYMENLEAQGLSEKVIMESMNAFVNTVLRLLPSGLILWSLVIALVNYLTARRIFAKLNYQTPSVPDFRAWHLPWYTIWGLIIGLLCLVFGGEGKGLILQVIGGNLLFIYFYILMVLGVAVCAFFYDNIPFPSLMKIFIIILIVLTLPQVGLMAFAIIGLVDMVIDIRTIYENRVKGES